MSELSNGTKNHTSKSRETISLNLTSYISNQLCPTLLVFVGITVYVQL
jgi:hypothetical protein